MHEPPPRTFRALLLVTDAFGGRGGIAKFNRDLLASIAAMPECAEVVALPRLIPTDTGPLPSKLNYVARAARGKVAYVWEALRQALSGQFDVVICAHINLSPLATLVEWIIGAHTILIVHGIDAWTPHRNPLVRQSLSRFARILGVSELTLARLRSWSGLEKTPMRVLSNCVDLHHFRPGPKSADLARSLNIENHTVLMTMGRLAGRERGKGFDEIIRALPALAEKVPNVVYLVCGEGEDRARLESVAEQVGVHDRVRFTGYVPEPEKADYYRLADAYVMPSHGEGFGIVFLEAMACGIPVMGSRLDGGREALLDGELGVLVDPDDPADVVAGVLKTLSANRGVPPGLQRYSIDAFEGKLQAVMRETLALAP